MVSGAGWVNGIAMVLWGVLLRVTLGLHATWLVNSATHMWGSRRFETHDDSRNNWWVALLTGGEGWHNNHHAHPVSARHGLRWYEIDPNFWGIWLLAEARPRAQDSDRQIRSQEPQARRAVAAPKIRAAIPVWDGRFAYCEPALS